MASSSIKRKASTENVTESKSSDNGTSSSKKLRWAADVEDNEPDKKDTALEKKSPRTKIQEKTIRMCQFCGKSAAAIGIKRENKKNRALCLLHYYTTSAVHSGEEKFRILDENLVGAQLNDTKKNSLNVQELFAEAFVQLQNELAQESLNIQVDQVPADNTKKNPRQAENDPLSILHDLGRSQKKRLKAPPPPQPKSSYSTSEGGFLRPINIPERLRRTQQQQAKLQAEQIARMNRAAKKPVLGKPDVSKRRHPTRKSIWNSVMDGKDKINSNKEAVVKKKILNNVYHEVDLTVDDVTCSCGSTNVSSAGNITSRNQDMRKGETWGMKDRSDDVVLRFRCNQCGKIWQEAG